jgi:hypothetical protein
VFSLKIGLAVMMTNAFAKGKSSVIVNNISAA